MRRDGVGSPAAAAAGRLRADGIQHDAGCDHDREARGTRDERGQDGARRGARDDARHRRRNRARAPRSVQRRGARRGAHTMSVTKVEKPWGYELHWAKTDRYVGKVLHIKAGHALSLQYHEKKDETIYVHSGRMMFEIGPKGGPLLKREMTPGDSVHVTP